MPICKKKLGHFFGVGLGRQDGVMAGRMKAQHDFCARWTFDAQALRADGNASIAAGFDCGANTPNIRPPGAARSRTHDGAFFRFGEIPSPLWDHP